MAITPTNIFQYYAALSKKRRLDAKESRVRSREMMISSQQRPVAPVSTEDKFVNAQKFFEMGFRAGVREAMAQSQSDPSSGGGLGWINPKTYPIPEFGMILNQIGSGVCAGPVRTDLGYHLVWLEALKPGGRANLSKHWTEIESMALNQKQSKWFEMWIEKSKKNVYISINN